jgi:hypothetical protein
VFFALISAAGFFVAASVNDMRLGIFGTSWFGFSIIMYFTAFAIVSEVVPHRSRGEHQTRPERTLIPLTLVTFFTGLGQSVLYILTAMGGGFGCLLGGYIVNNNVGDKGGWRCRWNKHDRGQIFNADNTQGNIYISAILHVVGALALILFYRPLPAQVRETRSSYLQRLAKLDYVGAALFCSGWVPL